MVEPVEESPRPSSPLVWRRRLGAELLRLREAAGLRQQEAAKALRCSAGKISYLEGGEGTFKPHELEVLLGLYHVTVEDKPRYIAAAEAANGQAWWDRWGKEDLHRAERLYIGLEDGAWRLRAYHPAVIHGLLQIPSYTRAILEALRRHPEERIIRLMDLRKRRQENLEREIAPLELHLVVDEAAIRREVGGPDTLRDQRIHVAAIARSRRNVVVQVVPFDHGASGASFGQFSILDFPWEDDPGIVFIEGLVESVYVEGRERVYEHSLLFDRLTEAALTPEESIEFLLAKD